MDQSKREQDARLLTRCVVWFVIGSGLNWTFQRGGSGIFRADDVRDATVLAACFYAVRVARRLPDAYRHRPTLTQSPVLAERINTLALMLMGAGIVSGPFLTAAGLGPTLAVGLVSFPLIVISFNTYFAIRFGGGSFGTGESTWGHGGLRGAGTILCLSLAGLAVVLMPAMTLSLGVILPVLVLVISSLPRCCARFWGGVKTKA